MSCKNQLLTLKNSSGIDQFPGKNKPAPPEAVRFKQQKGLRFRKPSLIFNDFVNV